MTSLTALLYGQGGTAPDGEPTTLDGLLFGVDDGGDTPRGQSSAYSYNQRIRIDDVSMEEVGSDDNDKIINLIPRTTVAGGIQAGNDFITDYEGFLEIENTATKDVGLELTVRFTHWFGSPEQTFVSTRQYKQRIGRNVTETIPLSIYNSRTQLRIGTFTTQDGTEITVTQEDLDNDIDIQLDIQVSIYNRAFGKKLTAAADTVELSEQLGSVHFWQLRDGNAPPAGVSADDVNKLIALYQQQNPDTVKGSEVAQIELVAQTYTNQKPLAWAKINNATEVGLLDIPASYSTTLTQSLVAGFLSLSGARKDNQVGWLLEVTDKDSSIVFSKIITYADIRDFDERYTTTDDAFSFELQLRYPTGLPADTEINEITLIFAMYDIGGSDTTLSDPYTVKMSVAKTG